MKMMSIVNITPWRAEEEVKKIIDISLESGVTDICLEVNAEPERGEYINKMHEHAARFKLLKAAAAEKGLRAGFLLQSFIGHGERGRPYTEASFQHITGPDGQVSEACFCPLDKNFLNYIAEVVKISSEADPDLILLEDDLRLGNHHPARMTCMCPLHMELHREISGRDIAPLDLYSELAEESVTGLDARETWHKVEQETFRILGETVRNSIDGVNPNLRCGICICSNLLPLAEDFARTVAGQTRPLIRLGHASYLESGHKNFAGTMNFIAAQREFLPDDIEYMSEADTWPQNLYSMSAKTLRGYIVGSLFAGANMPEVWMPVFLNWTLEECEVYTKTLAESKEFFSEVHKISEKVEWTGPAAICDVKEIIEKPWAKNMSGGNVCNPAWSYYLGRLGIPYKISSKNGGNLRMLAGDEPKNYSKNDLEEFFKGGLLLDGKAATVLSELGFSELMGVESVINKDLKPSYERLDDNKEINGEVADSYISFLNASMTLAELKILSNDVKEPSWYFSWPWVNSTEHKRLSASLTMFENKLGGRVAIFAESLFWYAYFNDRRKEQLRKVLNWLGKETLPVFVHNRMDTYVKYGKIVNADIVSIFNLNPDSMDPLTLTFGKGIPNRIEKLEDNGTWKTVDFTQEETSVIIDFAVETMRPLIMKIYF